MSFSQGPRLWGPAPPPGPAPPALPRACAGGGRGRSGAPPPSVVGGQPEKAFALPAAAPSPQLRVKWSCGRMSADSDPVVIVSAARTAIGEWPAGPAWGSLGLLGPSELGVSHLPGPALTAPTRPVRRILFRLLRLALRVEPLCRPTLPLADGKGRSLATS